MIKLLHQHQHQHRHLHLHLHQTSTDPSTPTLSVQPQQSMDVMAAVEPIYATVVSSSTVSHQQQQILNITAAVELAHLTILAPSASTVGGTRKTTIPNNIGTINSHSHVAPASSNTSLKELEAPTTHHIGIESTIVKSTNRDSTKLFHTSVSLNDPTSE